MNYYFKLQHWRLKRELTGLGMNPWVGYGFFLISFIGISELIFKKLSYSSYLYLFVALLMISSLGGEVRNQFLKSVFPPAGYRKIRLAENILCALPFSIFLGFKQNYAISVLTLILSGVLSFYNKAGRPGFRIPSPFSKNPYEFTIGFRRTYLLFLAIFTVALISVYYHNFNLGIFCLLSVFLVCLTFYPDMELIYYVWIHAQSPKMFLRNKIKTALLDSFFLSLIVSVPLTFFNPSRLGIILLAIVIGLLNMVSGVLAAYVNFPMQKTVSQSFQFICALLFPPLLIGVIPNFYFQAVNRLKVYLK